MVKECWYGVEILGIGVQMILRNNDDTLAEETELREDEHEMVAF